jgi:hypothetical protein
VVLEGSEQASEILPTSAKLNASINPEGPQATKYHFEYGETEAYGQSTAETALTPGFEDQPASATVSGLQPSTTYHFRVVATNALSQTTLGPDQTFTTAPPVSIESESASQVSASSAKLSTELNAHGLPSEFRFEYGTSTAYGQSAPVPDAEAGESSQSATFSVAIQNLSPQTTYHYRVVAHNALGTSEGPDRTFTTQGIEASPLADDRDWEMVSPSKKHGVSLEAITREGGAIQAAADGSGLAYIALGPATGEPQGNRSSVPSELLSRRTAPGAWGTQDITTPHQGAAGVFPGDPSEYKLFSADLSRAALEPFGATPLSPQTSERTPYRREADGTFTPLVYPGNVAAGTKFGGEEVKPEEFLNGVAFVTATPDLSHLLVNSPTSLVEGFETPGGSGIYEWSAGTLAPVSILSDGTATGGFVGNAGSQMRGAISDDGTRVFFVGAADTNLYVRDTTLEKTLRVDAAEEGVKESEGGAKFQLASPDGQRVLFTDEQRLTKDATAKAGEPDLYECAIEVAGVELRCALHDLSVDPHLGEAASVQGAVLGASEDGRLVYFVAKGALGEEEEGEEAKGGQCPDTGEGQCVNLYVYDTQTGTRHLVAVLSGEDRPDWNAGEDTDLGELTSRVSPDGRYLAFMSKRSLTGYDNRDASTGALDQEVYEYDSQSGKLSCASCDPTGQRPAGVFDVDEFPGLLVDRPQLWGGQTLAGSIPGWTRVDFRFQKNAVYQSRYLANSGRLFFNSPVGLVPGDGNSTEDVYEYEPQGIGSCGAAPACVSLVSSGTSAEESAFLDASESGDDVFFLTAAQLSGEDEDNALDAYDAHVCSLAPGCAPPSPGSPPPCASADACRAAPTPQPGIFGAPASSTFSGAGNLIQEGTLLAKGKVKALAKAPTRKQKLAKALAACKKKPKAKRAACRRKAQRQYGSAKAARKARARAKKANEKRRRALQALRAKGSQSKTEASPSNTSGSCSSGESSSTCAQAPSSSSSASSPSPATPKLSSPSAPAPSIAAAPALSAAQGESPWWHLTQNSRPASIPTGGEGKLVLQAINLGNGVTSGPVTFSDQLPAGLHLQSVFLTAFSSPNNALNLATIPAIPGVCETTASSVSCSTEKLEEGAEPLVKPIQPYEDLELILTVKDEGAAPGAENRAEVSGGSATPLTLKHAVSIGAGAPSFGAEDFAMVPEEEGGGVDTQAGSHPYQLTTSFALNQSEDPVKPPALPRNLRFNLPAGLIGNATLLPQCSDLDFRHVVNGGEENLCPADTVVGVASVTVDEPVTLKLITLPVPLFNLVPEKGEPARFGFEVVQAPVTLDTSVRTGSDYGVSADVSNISQLVNFLSTTTTFWGVPGDKSHDSARGWSCLVGGHWTKTAGRNLPCLPSSQSRPDPFLTMPSSCSLPFTASVEGLSWPTPQAPGGVPFAQRPYNLTDAFGRSLGISGCNQLPFAPTIEAQPDVQSASSPTGLSVHVRVPQEVNHGAEGIASSSIKDTTVTLPEGVSTDPSGADGLAACAESEVGFQQVAPDGSDLFTPTLPNPFCPSASKIGTVEFKVPVIEHPLKGAIYLATQNQNPFGSLIALYIVAEDPVSGVLLKLAGEVKLNQATGQITTTFHNSPQAPLEEATFSFFGGDRAPLTTPSHCGSYTTEASFTPWSETPPVNASSTFQVTTGPNGSPCPGTLPFAPSLAAGMTNIQAGAFSPLSTTITREDGNQDIQTVQLHMPPGLSGILAGIPLCHEAEANAGTCSPASEIGKTIVSVGLGGDPFTVTGGQVFLTEAYKGAPFGLSIVNPAKAGPFDLGKVIVRAKLEVDPHTAAITVSTDQIPHILDGIPLQIKHVNVTIDRPGFTFNPTNCSPLPLTGAISSVEGASAPVSVPFQITNCAALKFAPKFAVSTAGKTSKANGASLHVKLTYPNGPQGTYANVAKTKVSLPKQLPSRLTTLQKACTAQVFDQNPASCPAASVVAHAKVITPLLPVPLTGPAYFVSHGGEAFPDLTIVLQGYGITVDLVGSTQIKSGITTTTFKAVPDAPFSSFELDFPQGPNSALAANANLCSQKLTMPTEFVAQNGALQKQDTKIAVTGCPKKETNKQKLAKALKACKKKHAKGKRRSCETQARRRLGGKKG